MSLVVLGSAKGSPGVTTTGLALASWWHRPLVVMEADPAGGDIAARFGLPEEPGLVGMAAALRHNPDRQPSSSFEFENHIQPTSTGIRVIVAPASAHQATASLDLLFDASPPPSDHETDLLIDIGRASWAVGTAVKPNLQPRSAGWSWTNAADLFIWISRPHLADLAHLAAALDLDRHYPRVEAIVLLGDGPYPADEVARTLGLPVLSRLP